MKSLPQWSATILLAAPVGAWALGLGDIELQSGLNQPFRAEINLLSVTAEELDGLEVGLASREAFERYGLDRSSALSSLEFEVVQNASGQYVVLVTSTRPIENPFLTMLVEAAWPRGRLLREYTVLLDPPVFAPGVGGEPPVRQAEAGAAPAGPAGGAIARAPAAARDSSPAPAVPAPPQPSSASSASPASVDTPPPAASADAGAALGGVYGPIRNAETLWSIASRLRPSDITINQMMVAIFEENPAAFDDNMNLLLRGATLTIPERSRLLATTPEAATAVVLRHEQEWARGRSAGERLAAESAPDGEPSALAAAASGGESTAPAEDASDAPAASVAAAGGETAAAAEEETPEARLRLVPPSADSVIGAGTAAEGTAAADGDGAAGPGGAAAEAEIARLESEVTTLRGELEESRRLLALRDEQLRALQEQLAGAGTTVASDEAPVDGAVAPGVDLEERIFADEPDAGAEGDEAQTAAEGDAAGTDAGNTDAVAAAEASAGDAAAETPAAEADLPPPSVPPPAVRPTPAPPEPSLLARVFAAISNPFLLIGLGVGAVLLTAVWYLRHRREEVEDVTGRWDALEAEVEEEVRAATARMKRGADESLIVEEQPGRADVGLDDVDGAFAAASGSAASESDDDIDSTLSSQTVINLDQGDTIAEADFHMAYGLYDQAAELVLKALESEPTRRDLKLKLLEVYFVWGNRDAFRDAARDLKAEIGDSADADWDKVLIMGKQLSPDDPLFAEAAGGGEVDVDLQADGSPELDFAFDKDGGLDLESTGSGDSLDLELAATGERLGTAADDDAVDDLETSLDIGERTAAGLEAALFAGDDDDEGAAAALGADDTGTATTPDVDFDGLGVTQESPTVESAHSGFDDWAGALGLDEEATGQDLPTVETPTVETAGPDSPTVETPTVETAGPDAPTVETPTMEAMGPDAPTVETPMVETMFGNTQQLDRPSSSTIEVTGIGPGEHTEEIDLDDLGLSVADLDGLPDDIGELPGGDAGTSDTREQPTLSGDEDLLSASGVTEIIGDDDIESIGTAVLSDGDATLLASRHEETLSGTEILEQEEEESGGTSLLQALDPAGASRRDAAAGNGLDLDLDDLAAALSNGDTVEQPRSSFDGDVFEGGSTPVDLDVGFETSESDDPTATEDIGSLDPHTMTEIGTKLDLARAYIDMGDPDGARSILEEVLDEGDAGQRREAQGLIDALTG